MKMWSWLTTLLVLLPLLANAQDLIYHIENRLDRPAGDIEQRLDDRIRERFEDCRSARQNTASAEFNDTDLVSFRSTEENSVWVDGWLRSYRLFVPPIASPNAPLVIVLHGTYGTGRKMQLGLDFDAHARRHGFLVAYPDAYRVYGERFTHRWNDGREGLASAELGIDDLAFVAAMIDDIANRHGIDRDRVFVTGASNGGIMSYRLGCQLGEMIRAIAPVIANLAEPLATDCTPPRGLSILAINGAADPYIPLDGGQVCAGVDEWLCEGGWVLSQSNSLLPFAQANECRTIPISRRRAPDVDDGTSVEDRLYFRCATPAEVRAVIVHGMGHVWPPRSGQTDASGPSSHNLDATQEIVAFFMGHR